MSYSPCDLTDDVFGILDANKCFTRNERRRLERAGDFGYVQGEIVCDAIRRLIRQRDEVTASMIELRSKLRAA